MFGSVAILAQLPPCNRGIPHGYMTSSSSDGAEIVGLLSEGNRSEELNEEHTLQARFFGWACGLCEQPIDYPNLRVVREGTDVCHPCWNTHYREEEDRDYGKDYSRSKFRRLSHLEHEGALNHLDPEVVSLTPRAASRTKRKWGDVEAAYQKLDEAQRKRLKASVDYLATMGTGIQGYYCCRKGKQLDPDKRPSRQAKV